MQETKFTLVLYYIENLHTYLPKICDTAWRWDEDKCHISMHINKCWFTHTYVYITNFGSMQIINQWASWNSVIRADTWRDKTLFSINASIPLSTYSSAQSALRCIIAFYNSRTLNYRSIIQNHKNAFKTHDICYFMFTFPLVSTYVMFVAPNFVFDTWTIL